MVRMLSACILDAAGVRSRRIRAVYGINGKKSKYPQTAMTLAVTASWHTEHVVGAHHVVHVYMNTSDAVGRVRQHCDIPSVLQLEGRNAERNSMDSDVVAICHTSQQLTPPTPWSNRTSSIAMCIPPVYGNVTLIDVLSHVHHHREIGVTHTFLYMAEVMPWSALDLPSDITLIDLPWIPLFRTSRRAQGWQTNDCIHRAASAGYEWALSIDGDEFVHLADGFASLGALIAQHGGGSVRTGHMQPLDAYTFGSRVTPNISQPAASDIWCANASLFPAHLCEDWYGRRKHLVRTSTAWVVVTHKLDLCRQSHSPRREFTLEQVRLEQPPSSDNAIAHESSEHGVTGRGAVIGRECRVHHLDARQHFLMHTSLTTALQQREQKHALLAHRCTHQPPRRHPCMQGSRRS